jgi:hypothetical protein
LEFDYGIVAELFDGTTLSIADDLSEVLNEEWNIFDAIGERFNM